MEFTRLSKSVLLLEDPTKLAPRIVVRTNMDYNELQINVRNILEQPEISEEFKRQYKALLGELLLELYSNVALYAPLRLRESGQHSDLDYFLKDTIIGVRDTRANAEAHATKIFNRIMDILYK